MVAYARIDDPIFNGSGRQHSAGPKPNGEIPGFGEAPPFGGAEAPRRPIRPTPFVWRDPSTIPPRQWLYSRHFIRKFVSTTVSPGGFGKSSLELVEAVAMATGRDLIGASPAGKLTVWYWNGEDPLEETERRVMAIMIHYGISPEEIAGRLFLDSGRDVRLVVAEKVGDRIVVAAPLVQELTDAVRELKIDVVVVDPFVSSHGVPENDNGAIDRVVKTWARLADECNCSVELVHHVRKGQSGQGDYTVDDARGAVALIGAVRSARVLNVMSKDEAERAEVDPEQRAFHFRVDNGKSNMAPPVGKAVWRKLVGVDLGNATAEQPADNIGVVTTWHLPALFDNVTADDLRKVQAKIASGSWAENIQAANWAGYAVAEALDLAANAKGEKQKLKSLLDVWIGNGALKVSRERDTRNGRDKPMIVVGVEP